MWSKVRDFFKDSETIAMAWAYMALGVVSGLLTVADPALVSPVLHAVSDRPWVIPLYLLLNGAATKWLRERRERDM